MKAICRKDYERVLDAQKYLAKNPSFTKRVCLDRIDARELNPTDIKALGFHEIYGVFFCGELARYLAREAEDQCRIVYLSVASKNLTPGECSNISAGGCPARLFFWWAQGYPRGAVVWADDEHSLCRLRRVQESGPWRFDEILAV